MDWVRRSTFILFGLKEREYSWRGLLLLIYVYLGSLLFAALVAPWVYFLVQAWAQAFPNGLSSYLSGKAFDNYFDRLRYVPIVLGLPWLLGICKLRSWQALSISLDKESCIAFMKAFACGSLLLAGIALIQIMMVPVSLKAGVSIVSVFTMGLLGAFIVALLEEVIFRGLIVRLFYTAVSPLPAVLLSSLFFAYVHFKMPSEVWHMTDEVVTWKSGFFVGFWTLIGIVHDFQGLAFANLFLLGCALAFLFLRTRSLMPCIGLHAGMVWVMLVYKKLFLVPETLLWGGTRIVDGLLALCLLLLLNFYLVSRGKSTALYVLSSRKASQSRCPGRS